jgi:hypothetical protein
MRLERLSREPAPSARFREEIVRNRETLRSFGSSANAAALDEIRLAAQASVAARIVLI